MKSRDAQPCDRYLMPMAEAHGIVDALEPVILLLLLGVLVAIGSRALRLSPIVGYLALGLGLRSLGVDAAAEWPVVSTLAELGVVFLLFDIGLHFSLARIREQARDIFGFGAVQVLLGTLGLGALAWLAGMEAGAALLIGGTLALSSTAVVARLIAERHQQSCPVGRTATSILIFQDVAAIFLLIVAGALGREDGSVIGEMGLAVVKAVGAFAVAALLARVVIRPLFDVVGRTENAEVFTATALLVALAAGWATGAIGLSLTLGAFLGGMIIADTPYRPIIESEIKPFRGLLLSFFFISVGASIDPALLARSWPAVIAAALGLILAKGVLNAAASVLFRWSIPGSTQLGFLLAQGSEFAFVVLSLPPVRALVGEDVGSVLVAAVAVSLAVTPTVADLGRRLAGQLRQRRTVSHDPELTPLDPTAPVLIVGMGEVGRTLADALRDFDVRYDAIERDPRRFAEANADGYAVVLGDTADPRIWEPMQLRGRRIFALTAPNFATSSALGPLAQQFFPSLKRFAAVRDEDEGARFRSLGVEAVVDGGTPRGVELAAAILAELGIERGAIDLWMRRQRDEMAGLRVESLPDAA